MSRETRANLDRQLVRVQERFSGTLGIAAKNLLTGEEVLVNAAQSFPTASVIKLAVLVEVFEQAKKGSLDLSERLTMQQRDPVGGSGVLKVLAAGLQPTIRDLCTLMVIVSDNTATNMLIDRIGGTTMVNQTMRHYGLDSITLHNRVDFERIGADVARFGEATPQALMHLVELLVRGEFGDAESCEQMIEILRSQQYLDQFPRYFAQRRGTRTVGIDEEFWVGCKTGFFPGTWVDSGVMALPSGIEVVYAVMTHGSSDLSIASETEGAVTNGIIGRLLLEYWWPSDDSADVPTLASLYFDKKSTTAN